MMSLHRSAIICALFAQAFSSVPTFAKEPLYLEPSTKWLINYGEDSCRLARKFGTDDNAVMLTIDRFQPGDWFNMAVSGQPVQVSGTRETMEIQFGPVEAEQQRDFKRGEMADKRPALIFTEAMRLAPYTAAEQAAVDAAKGGDALYLDMIGPEREKAVTSIRFGSPLSQPLIIQTGSLGAPLAALQRCTDELLDHWGVDLAALATQSRPVRPIGNPGRWMNSSDYPTNMLTRGYQGIVHFRLSVGTEGSPTACHIQQSTRPAEFDEAVCKAIMKRAKFAPALDAAGRPIASYYLNTVNFQF